MYSQSNVAVVLVVASGVVFSLDSRKATFYFDEFVQDDDMCLFCVDTDWAGVAADDF